MTKKKIRLGIIGFTYKWQQKLSVADLERLGKNALGFYPLSNIFTISAIKTRKVCGKYWPSKDSIESEEIDGMKKDTEVIAIIRRRNLCWADTDEKKVYSIDNPIVTAHELGHIVGLKHPSSKCNYGECSEEYFKQCPYSENIMGCNPLSKEVREFSSKDINQLENLAN